MSDIDQHEANATPRAELEKQIMDPHIPKNEREWWAAAEIDRLRAIPRDIQVADSMIRELRTEVERLTAFFDEAVNTLEKRNAEIGRLKAENEQWYDAVKLYMTTGSMGKMHELVVAREALEPKP